ncbi:MAG: acyl carrier protein [Limisphaerales bacterium]
MSIAQVVLILLAGTMLLIWSGVLSINFPPPVPLSFGIVFFLAAIGCASVATSISDEVEKRRALSSRAGRPALNEIEFGQHYFSPNRAEIATKLRAILSRHIAIDLSQLQPNDRFVEDLRMDALDSLSTVEFIIEVEKEFEITIPNAAAEKMKAFQCVLDYVSEAVKVKALGSMTPTS